MINKKAFDYTDIVSFLEENIDNEKIDLKDYEFIDPVYWAILKCLKTTNEKLKIFPPQNDRANNYLKMIVGKSFSSTTVPMRYVSNRGETDKFTKELVEILVANSTDYDRDDLNFFKYIITELLNNSIDHGESPAVVCAQRFPKINEFEIAVVDSGLGFYHTLRRRYNVKSEEEAIKKALEKGVTGSITYLYGGSTRNAGNGLYVISNIVKDSLGDLFIVSGNTFYDYKNNYVQVMCKNWQGSIVLIRMSLLKFKERVFDIGLYHYFTKVLTDVYDEEIF